MAKARPGARYWTARRKRAAARLALVVVVLALFSIPAPRYYERRRQRLTHIAALDPHFREEWEADRPWRLPGSCESRLGAVLPELRHDNQIGPAIRAGVPFSWRQSAGNPGRASPSSAGCKYPRRLSICPSRARPFDRGCA